MASSFSVPAASSTGGTTQSLIVGDNPTPYASALLGGSGTDTLTTGDLSVGDELDFGGLASFAVEFWYKPSALPASNMTICRGPSGSGASSWQWIVIYNTTGTLSAFSYDETTTQRLISAVGSISPGTVNHIVYTSEGSTLRLYINAVQVGSVSFSGHTVKSLAGTAGNLDVAIGGVASSQTQIDEMALYRTGLTATRVLRHYEAGTIRGYTDQTTAGFRINAVLDTVSNHAPRSLQIGTREVIPRYMTGQAPLEEVQRAVEAEDVNAAFFTTADGTLKFLADGHRSSSPYNTVQMTAGDAGGSEIPYVDLKLADYSNQGITNEWNVTRTPFRNNTPVTQTASDATSIAAYGRHSESLSDVPCCSDADALLIANGLLAKTKDPLKSIVEITFDTSDPATAEAVFRRELMDKITVKRTPPGGGSRISQDVFIQNISISQSNDGHAPMVTWGVSPI